MCTNDIYVHIYTPRYSPLTAPPLIAPLRTINRAHLAILDNVKAPSYRSRRGLDTDRNCGASLSTGGGYTHRVLTLFRGRPETGRKPKHR